MSFLFGGGRPQPTSAEKIAAAENEVEMVSDMFNRYACNLVAGCISFNLFEETSGHLPLMDSPLTTPRLTQSCLKKCIPADYREGDLNKAESVCLDRCVAKFFEVNMKVSEKMQGEAAMRQGGGGGGGGMFGM
ncbi:mitochondrial import inner membrane translocase subunit tim10 [Fonsecaea nubica]|uniref:Mitochondrial import inner membrane translocase subunit n=1 Tax=Fonsecaea nubica TaxID=856822 RepID=A0A178D0V1_9EURO|nr:mitochondrial import inner membrane translocase subunit tim10 [Fonsecaea nubica]OAL35738.1 mitochondrial import inner membrane translocase subunit tim10 [Fonsecaea nubica]